MSDSEMATSTPKKRGRPRKISKPVVQSKAVERKAKATFGAEAKRKMLMELVAPCFHEMSVKSRLTESEAQYTLGVAWSLVCGIENLTTIGGQNE